MCCINTIQRYSIHHTGFVKRLLLAVSSLLHFWVLSSWDTKASIGHILHNLSETGSLRYFSPTVLWIWVFRWSLLDIQLFTRYCIAGSRRVSSQRHRFLPNSNISETKSYFICRSPLRTNFLDDFFPIPLRSF